MDISELVDLDLAKKAALKGVCDHCLGRQFAKLGHGMTNQERGMALRMTLIGQLTEEKGKEGVGKTEDGKPIKKYVKKEGEQFSLKPPKQCWLCENLFDETEKFSELVIKKLQNYEYDTFLIGSKIDAEIMDREEMLWGELGNQNYEPIKAEINREVGKLIEANVDQEVNFERPDIVAIIDTRYDNVELQISSFYIFGRYRKLIRGIPQTRWPCKTCWGKGCEKCDFTGKMYETSVEEIIAKEVIKATDGQEHSFHGMGREDIDVRMLGNGRPFILEIKNPAKRHVNMQELEMHINASSKEKVEVFSLRPSKKEEVVAIKKAKFPKTYEINVEFDKPIEHEKLNEVVSAFKDKIIEQKTPKRVLHRRADKIRKRAVIDIGIESVDKKGAKFKITGESGIYVKELVHGDEGRTKPNISDYLNAKCEILSLDVTQIHDMNGGIEKW